MVSTNVGGVPEVLPPDMVQLADPNPASLTAALSRLIPIVQEEGLCGAAKGEMVDVSNHRAVGCSSDFHKRVGEMYSWHMVAQRTGLLS